MQILILSWESKTFSRTRQLCRCWLVVAPRRENSRCRTSSRSLASSSMRRVRERADCRRPHFLTFCLLQEPPHGLQLRSNWSTSSAVNRVNSSPTDPSCSTSKTTQRGPSCSAESSTTQNTKKNIETSDACTVEKWKVRKSLPGNISSAQTAFQTENLLLSICTSSHILKI